MYSLSPFLLITFSILNSFWFVFPQFFFIKCRNRFFSVKITNNICPRNSIINFFNIKNFFRSIWNLTFCKNVFMFWNFYMVTNIKFRIFFIVLVIEINICAWLYINRIHFYCAMWWWFYQEEKSSPAWVTKNASSCFKDSLQWWIYPLHLIIIILM